MKGEQHRQRRGNGAATEERRQEEKRRTERKVEVQHEARRGTSRGGKVFTFQTDTQVARMHHSEQHLAWALASGGPNNKKNNNREITK